MVSAPRSYVVTCSVLCGCLVIACENGASLQQAAVTSSAEPQPTTSSIAGDGKPGASAATEVKLDPEQQRRVAEAAERARLLASEEPEDWKALKERFPDSREAEEATGKLAAKASICADLPRWTRFVTNETLEIGDVMRRLRRRNRVAKGPMELLKIMDEMGKECARHQATAEKADAELRAHAITPGEDDIRLELSLAVEDLGIAWKKYAEGFRAGTKGFADLIKWDLYAQDVLSPNHEKLVPKLKAACLKLAPKK